MPETLIPRPLIAPTAHDWTGGRSSGNADIPWQNPFPYERVESATDLERRSQPVPSVAGLLSEEVVSTAVDRIREIAMDVFGSDAINGDLDLSAGFDEVLGGPFLCVERSVSGIDRESYRGMRRAFDQAVRESLTPEQLAKVIWASRLDA